MAGCADGKELQMSDSRHAWTRQPLESGNAATAGLQTTNFPAQPPPYYWTCFQQAHLSASNYNPAAAATEPQQCKREADNWVSSRWNPTPEQLRSLEELYRSGTRTPTAKQIQQIAAKLRRFGRIEGKNVFYWFQNHKSRERQKHHRKMNFGLKKPSSVPKQSGLTRTDFEIGQANCWASRSNSATSSEESVSLQRAVIAECNTDERIKIEERERELRQSSGSRKLTVGDIWQKIGMTPATTCTTAPETLLEARSQKFSKELQFCSMIMKPEHGNFFDQELLDDERRREAHTLQLFPLRHNDLNIPTVARGDDESVFPALTAHFTPVESSMKIFF